jgi:hypothetical protein
MADDSIEHIKDPKAAEEFDDSKSMVNSQILDMIAALEKTVIDNPKELASAGLALAISQTACIALQDVTDHARRVHMLSEAAFARVLTDPNHADKDQTIAMAEAASSSAIASLSKVSETAAALLASLPRP